MKKQSFQGVLCVLAGIVLAVIIMAFMFKNLQWPGGDLLLAVIVPAMMAILSIDLSCYVSKHGALKAIEGKAKPYAHSLLVVEMIAFNALALFFVALIFRICHWPGAALLLLISCILLAILSILAGFFAWMLLSKK